MENQEHNNSVEQEKKAEQNADNQEIKQDTEVTDKPQEPKQEPTIEEKYALLNDSYIRLMAEFDNYRKRTQKEKLELIMHAGEGVISSILPVIDNMERALENIEKSSDTKAIMEGVQLIYQQFIQILAQKGLKEISTESRDFDTEFHEAITTIPAPSEDLKGKIIDCTMKGYTLNDKVIRHSKVVIGE